MPPLSSSGMSPFIRSEAAPVVAFVACSAISPPVSPANGSFFAADLAGAADVLETPVPLSDVSWPGWHPVSPAVAAAAMQRAASAVRRMAIPWW